jgi:hypothetical protein
MPLIRETHEPGEKFEEGQQSFEIREILTPPMLLSEYSLWSRFGASR